MASVSNKRMSRIAISRLILISGVGLFDILLIPWFMQFPRFVVKNIATAPQDWIKFGYIHSYSMLFSDSRFFHIFLILQIPIVALIIGIAWDTERLKKKNKIKDGVGGPEPSGDGQFGTSRWQDKTEMDETCSVWYTNKLLEKGGGIVFGMEKSNKGIEKVWLNQDDLHTLILGATRSGKSRKIIIPSIWQLGKTGESMVIGDPKGELFITTKAYLEGKGYNVISLNLREPLKGNQWNILDIVNKAVDAGDIPKATQYAWSIANTICSQTPSASAEPIWKNGEMSTLAALILLTVLDSKFAFQRHMTTAYYLLAEYGQQLDDETIPLIDYIKALPIKHPAKAAFATAMIAPYKTRASFFTSALADLRLFSDPNIGDMTSEQDHKLEDIGIKKTAIFLIIPDEDKTRNVMATIYIEQVYQAMVTLANKHGGRIPRRVNFILDEFGNLPAIPEFESKITVAGGRGMRFTIAIQDIAQLKKLYDKNSQTITGNCHNWIYIKTADLDTAKLISEKTGKYTVETDNTSVSIQSKGHSRTHGLATTGRALLMPDEILRWSTDESLLIPISDFPARYPLPDLSMWSANTELGFAMTGNMAVDKQSNLEIIQKRWEEIDERELKEVEIWLPDIANDSDEEDEEEKEKLKAKINISSSSNTIKTELYTENSESNISENTEEINIGSLLQNLEPETEEEEKEEDFL
ncbi:VirD4-like conjugal transfer protein, CD1115 family [Clostridium estertheticum]|uniref:VirD4-like conjugal transfer protein, CD1115 family n=1 Tax=Clostridium estertheticum TaxID=238834 RepID=UPI001C0AE7A2|nr:type IV secretory system conjugative DNA transfer family protein [Clostridium estertheticum]MBU3173277.1 type IV secretory system conjugative DNA transfer family protein [Clostridium estertheticum]